MSLLSSVSHGFIDGFISFLAKIKDFGGKDEGFLAKIMDFFIFANVYCAY